MVKNNPSWLVNQLNQIAQGHVAEKDDTKAVLVLKKSLDICRTYTPPIHFLSTEELESVPEKQQQRPLPAKYMIWTLVSLAEIYNRQKNFEEAKGYYEKALLIASRIYGEADTPKLDIVCKVGQFYYKTGSTKSARELFMSVLTLKKKHSGPAGAFTPYPALANYYLGLIEFDENNVENALRRLNLSWEQHKAKIGVADIRTARVVAALGKTHAALKDYKKAREMVEFAGSIFTANGLEDEIPPLVEVHKQIISNIPGATGMLSQIPHATRNGFIMLDAAEQ